MHSTDFVQFSLSWEACENSWSFVKSESLLSQLELGNYKSISVKLCYKLASWSIKDMNIYQTGRLYQKNIIDCFVGNMGSRVFEALYYGQKAAEQAVNQTFNILSKQLRKSSRHKASLELIWSCVALHLTKTNPTFTLPLALFLVSSNSWEISGC